jgi:hypothetical protein
MTINLAVNSRLPHKIGNTSIDSMKLGHELVDIKFAANIKMVPDVEALPMTGVLLLKTFLRDLVKDLHNFVFRFQVFFLFFNLLALRAPTSRVDSLSSVGLFL